VRGLRLLGAQHVDYLVPDRVVDGYGLTPPIARRVKERGADVLITVDNGIASVEGVAEAQALGLQVLVTDHHLPGARAAGSAHRMPRHRQPQPARLRLREQVHGRRGRDVLRAAGAARRTAPRGFRRRHTAQARRPAPLVALGTVADVVKLDANNRRLVAQGLKRMRAGADAPGWPPVQCRGAQGARVATTFDFGFALGPRINAAGRLSDMTLGIECLLTDDAGRADELAAAGRHQPRAPRDRGRHARAGLCRWPRSLLAPEASRRRAAARASACSTPTSTKAWSASWPRA
jgi:single-stranded-DNA-specific exonuclease